jgi:hypothetical protein
MEVNGRCHASTTSAAREISIPTEQGAVGPRDRLNVLWKIKSLTQPKFEHQNFILQHNPEIQVNNIYIYIYIGKGRGKVTPLQARCGSEGG